MFIGISSLCVLFMSLFYYFSNTYVLPNYLQRSDFEKNLEDSDLKELFAVGLWTSACLLVDFFLDAVEHVSMGHILTHRGVYGFTFEWLVRLMFISCLGVQSLVQYNAPPERKIVLAWFSECYTRIVAYTLCSATMSDTFEQRILERRGTLLTTLLYAVSQLVAFFCALAPVQSDAVLQGALLARVGLWISFMLLCGLCLLCWRSLVHRARLLGWRSINTKEWTFTLYSFMFGSCYLVYFFLRTGGANLSRHLESSSVVTLQVYVGSWIVFAVVAVLLPVRIARLHIRKARHRIMSTKRDVSELVNAPLKVVQASLSYILSNPDMLTNPACREHLALVASACETTIEKLVHISRVPDEDAYTTVQSEVSAEDRFRGDPTLVQQHALSSEVLFGLGAADVSVAPALSSVVGGGRASDLEAPAVPSWSPSSTLLRNASSLTLTVNGRSVEDDARGDFLPQPPAIPHRAFSAIPFGWLALSDHCVDTAVDAALKRISALDNGSRGDVGDVQPPATPHPALVGMGKESEVAVVGECPADGDIQHYSTHV